jgi:putative polymerase
MSNTRALAPRIAIGLVVAASLYTAILCLVNTHVMAVSNTLVAVVDGAILLTALALALLGGPRWLWMLLLAIAVNFLTLAILSDRLELKAVRDPLVLVTFAALGWRYGSFARARLAFFIVAAIVLVVGLVELLAPQTFTQALNILQFYNARGMVNAQDLERLDSAFFISGSRGGERELMLLPLLGSHRVSSIFLEPVSMGNFGAIALVFALSLDRTHWRSAVAAALVGVIVIVLADARFASMAALLLLLARLMPAGWTRVGVSLLPLVAIGVLFAFAFSTVGAGDDLPTRLAGSGRTLLAMEPAAMFGLAPHQVTTYDAGYAYALSALGLPLCIVLWVAYVAAPASTRQAQRCKLLLGVYICALLCVSGTSLFALKTAALGFFIFGALAARQEAHKPAPRPVHAPLAPAAPA